MWFNILLWMGFNIFFCIMFSEIWDLSRFIWFGIFTAYGILMAKILTDSLFDE